MGKGNKEIADITGVTLYSVQHWTKKCKDTGGVVPPFSEKKTGRPHITSMRTLKVLKRQVDNEPRIGAKELKENNPRFLHDISVQTIQKCLRDDLKFQYHAPQRKHIFTAVQMKKRLRFCCKYLAWDLENRKNVLWSDKATFTVTGKLKRENEDQIFTSLSTLKEQ